MEKTAKLMIVLVVSKKSKGFGKGVVKYNQ